VTRSSTFVRTMVPIALAIAGAAVTVQADAGGISAAAASRKAPTATVYLQTMDSCKQALGGAAYQLTGNGLDRRVKGRSQTKQRVAAANECPLQQGDCASIKVGCVSFSGIPAGAYAIHETRTPTADASNPEGYAACNGGSACRSQWVTVVVSSTGAVQARVTNVYPDGVSPVYPTAAAHSGVAVYAGTKKDPIVVHNFGLARPNSDPALQCDGDGDADDHLTGSPSSHCNYPEDQEAAACSPFPWSCTLGLWPATATAPPRP
jgi:hypothetical protein